MTIDVFLKQYGIEIKNRRPYEEALTHNSYANEHHLKYTYQRLEFLGDAILQKYVSLYFFKNYSTWPEGKLTKLRSNAVREESLAAVSRVLGLGDFIRLGHGEINNRGFEKDSILSDVFESLTAAIYLDHGEEVTLNWLEKTLFKMIQNSNFLNKIHDYKSELQELLQAENRHDLKYVVEEEKPMADNRIEYTMAVWLDGQKYGVGRGFSKAHAEQDAARDCLSKMKNLK